MTDPRGTKLDLHYFDPSENPCVLRLRPDKARTAIRSLIKILSLIHANGIVHNGKPLNPDVRTESILNVLLMLMTDVAPDNILLRIKDEDGKGVQTWNQQMLYDRLGEPSKPSDPLIIQPCLPDVSRYLTYPVDLSNF